MELLLVIIEVLFAILHSQYIYGGDSAEFTTAALIWGIPHPPGYPLYALLSNIIRILIPFGTTAWKVSFLSSLPTVGTAYIIFRIGKELKASNFASFITSILYLFLFPVWLYALIPEVFALNSLLIALITYFLLIYQRTNTQRYLFYACFCIGLAVSHHHIFVIFIPAWISLIRSQLLALISQKAITTIISCAGFIFLGSTFYMYAVIASLLKTPMDWENAKTVIGMFRLITRSTYGSFRAYAGSTGNIINQLYDLASSFLFIFQDFRIFGITIILFTIAQLKKINKILYSFFTIGITSVLFFLFYTNFQLATTFAAGMYERFLLPLYFLLSLIFLLGIDELYRSFVSLVKIHVKNSFIQSIALHIGYLLFVGYVAIIGVQNFRTISTIRSERIFHQVGLDIIHSLPHSALFYVGTDNIHFSVLYHVVGEKKRKDLIFFQMNHMDKAHYVQQLKEEYPYLPLPNKIANQHELEAFFNRYAQKGVFFETPLPFGYWVPYGLLWKYYPTKTEAKKDLPNIISQNEYLWRKQIHIPQITRYQKNIFHLSVIHQFYIDAYITYAQLLVANHQLQAAETVLKEIVYRHSPSNILMQQTYINILVKQRKCKLAFSEANKLYSTERIFQTYPEIAASAIQYYQTCDTENRNIVNIKEILKHHLEKEKPALKSF